MVRGEGRTAAGHGAAESALLAYGDRGDAWSYACLVDEEDVRGVPDVLDPAQTVAGVDGVKRVVDKVRKVWLVSDPEALAPCRLTKRQARALLDRMEDGEAEEGRVRPVVVTARIEGPDAVIRTLEWLGDASRLGRPSKPAAAPRGRVAGAAAGGRGERK